MNQMHLVTAIKQKTYRKIPRAYIVPILDACMDIVIGVLAKGEDVWLPAIGKLTIHHRKERKGINPRTGVSMVIPTCNVAMFRSFKRLKDAINP